MILNQVSIEKRPAVLVQLSRIGDWEIDTIIGFHHQGVMLSLLERESLLCLIGQLANKSAQEVERTYHQLTFLSDQRKSTYRHL